MFGIGPSGVGQGFNLIPVDGVGEVAGVVCKVEDEENIGENGVEGTPNSDMTDGGMILRRLTKTHHTLSHTCSHV